MHKSLVLYGKHFLPFDCARDPFKITLFLQCGFLLTSAITYFKAKRFRKKCSNRRFLVNMSLAHRHRNTHTALICIWFEMESDQVTLRKYVNDVIEYSTVYILYINWFKLPKRHSTRKAIILT